MKGAGRYFGIRMVTGLILLYLMLYGVVQIGISFHQMQIYQDIHILNLKEPVENGKAAEKQITKENNYALFQETENVKLQNPEFGRTMEVTAVSLLGSSVFLFPSAYPLTAEDKAGCLVSRQTAWRLFGDVHVTGKKVLFQEKSYEIRGIVQNSQELFIYEPGNDEKLQFDTLSSTEPVSRFQSRYGFTGTESKLYWGRLPENLFFGDTWKKERDYLRFKRNNCVEILYLQKWEMIGSWIKVTGVLVVFLLLLKKYRKRD